MCDTLLTDALFFGSEFVVSRGRVRLVSVACVTRGFRREDLVDTVKVRACIAPIVFSQGENLPLVLS